MFSPVTALQMAEPKRAEFLTNIMDVDNRKDINSPAKKDDHDRVKDENKDSEMKSVNNNGNGSKLGRPTII